MSPRLNIKKEYMENENAIETQENDQTSAPAEPKAKARKAKGGPVGRPSLIKTDAFIAVANKSDTPEALIQSLAGLREYAERNGMKKAKQYVAMRAWSLRAKGVEIKTFASGKKSTKQAPVILAE